MPPLYFARSSSSPDMATSTSEKSAPFDLTPQSEFSSQESLLIETRLLTQVCLQAMYKRAVNAALGPPTNLVFDFISFYFKKYETCFKCDIARVLPCFGVCKHRAYTGWNTLEVEGRLICWNGCFVNTFYYNHYTVCAGLIATTYTVETAPGIGNWSGDADASRTSAHSPELHCGP